MITSDDSNQGLNRAFHDSTVQLWDQNLANGKYVIAYELDPGLDDKLKALLPKVCFRHSDGSQTLHTTVTSFLESLYTKGKNCHFIPVTSYQSLHTKPFHIKVTSYQLVHTKPLHTSQFIPDLYS